MISDEMDFDYGRGFIHMPEGGRKRHIGPVEPYDTNTPDQDRTWDEGEEPDGDS